MTKRRTLSDAEKARVYKAFQAGKSGGEIKKQFKIRGASTLVRLRAEALGPNAPRANASRKRKQSSTKKPRKTVEIKSLTMSSPKPKTRQTSKSRRSSALTEILTYLYEIETRTGTQRLLKVALELV